ncbi:hypothetical protein [Streptomyces albidoflavus]|uniref:hypothetical protein n=1 Tax=Streptomyces albidoflavus TaxID=1886 RepID=UPI0004CC73A8|nr:hypothetical protein [Streptomyces albidoflavus]
MALQIFETDPDARPAPKVKSEYTRPVFTFRNGMARNRKPVKLDNWRVVAEELEPLEAIAELLGGTAEEYSASAREPFHVLTDTDSVEIVINGAGAVEERMILWGPNGPIHECDGVEFLSPADAKGKPCGCPKELDQRKAWAQQGRGPKPNIPVTFRLAGLGYELGFGLLRISAWTFLPDLDPLKAALAAIDGEALCTLELEHISFINDKGEKIEYSKPKITVQGAYADAIAEER